MYEIPDLLRRDIWQTRNALIFLAVLDCLLYLMVALVDRPDSVLAPGIKASTLACSAINLVGSGAAIFLLHRRAPGAFKKRQLPKLVNLNLRSIRAAEVAQAQEWAKASRGSFQAYRSAKAALNFGLGLVGVNIVLATMYSSRRVSVLDAAHQIRFYELVASVLALLLILGLGGLAFLQLRYYSFFRPEPAPEQT